MKSAAPHTVTEHRTDEDVRSRPRRTMDANEENTAT